MKKSEILKIKNTIKYDDLVTLLYFVNAVYQKNKVMDLTAMDTKEWLSKHVLDSLIFNEVYKKLQLPCNRVPKAIDIGTGAGFPGFPIAVTNQKLNVDLLDSLNKRILFLNDINKQVKLDNLRTFHLRAEEASRKKEFRENYDLAFSRAVANLRTLLEYCVPFIKINGYFLSWKSSEVDEELKLSKNAMDELGVILVEDIYYELPILENDVFTKLGVYTEDFSIEKVTTIFNEKTIGVNYCTEPDFTLVPNLEDTNKLGRRLLVFKKIKKTDRKYPRGQGKPKKNPL